MKNFFGQGGFFYKLLDRIGDLILLNFLFILTSLPVFTIGASLTALCRVTLDMCRNEESYIRKSYFEAFRENFRPATAAWLLFLAGGIVIALDLRFGRLLPLPVQDGLRPVYLALGLLLVLLAVYVFPQIAYFENTLKNYLLNSFYLAVRYVYFTVPMVLLALLPALALYVGGPMLGVMLPFYLILGFAVAAFADAFALRRIFAAFAERHSGARG